ncbi:unnamed protein product [Prunus armeniaca]
MPNSCQSKSQASHTISAYANPLTFPYLGAQLDWEDPSALRRLHMDSHCHGIFHEIGGGNSSPEGRMGGLGSCTKLLPTMANLSLTNKLAQHLVATVSSIVAPRLITHRETVKRKPPTKLY